MSLPERVAPRCKHAADDDVSSVAKIARVDEGVGWPPEFTRTRIPRSFYKPFGQLSPTGSQRELAALARCASHGDWLADHYLRTITAPDAKIAGKKEALTSAIATAFERYAYGTYCLRAERDVKTARELWSQEPQCPESAVALIMVPDPSASPDDAVSQLIALGTDAAMLEAAILTSDVDYLLTLTHPLALSAAARILCRSGNPERGARVFERAVLTASEGPLLGAEEIMTSFLVNVPRIRDDKALLERFDGVQVAMVAIAKWHLRQSPPAKDAALKVLAKVDALNKGTMLTSLGVWSDRDEEREHTKMLCALSSIV